jgi:hypothetical protein
MIDHNKGQIKINSVWNFKMELIAKLKNQTHAQ